MSLHENAIDHDFTRDDLKALAHLSERIEADVEWYGARLVVEVWDKADSGAIAWIERYPDDSHTTIRFRSTGGAA